MQSPEYISTSTNNRQFAGSGLRRNLNEAVTLHGEHVRYTHLEGVWWEREPLQSLADDLFTVRQESERFWVDWADTILLTGTVLLVATNLLIKGRKPHGDSNKW